MLLAALSLLGPYFTAVDLANFARELDEDERMRMAEGGLDSPQYLRYSLIQWSLHFYAIPYSRREKTFTDQ